MADGQLFSVGGKARLYIAKQNSRPPPSSAALRPLSLRSAVQVRSARRLVIVTKAAMGAANPTRDFTMATDRDDTDFEPPHTSSPTDHVLAELQLYGYRPFQDEADPRPLPEADTVGGAVADIFDALVSTLSDTRLEPDLEDLLWSTVNLFHRATDRIGRELDDNEQAQRRSQKEQDGSENQAEADAFARRWGVRFRGCRRDNQPQLRSVDGGRPAKRGRPDGASG